MSSIGRYQRYQIERRVALRVVSAGRVYLFSGRDGRVLQTYTSRLPGETLGFDAVGVGDVNGDGVTDLLVTRRGAGSTDCTADACTSSRAVSVPASVRAAEDGCLGRDRAVAESVSGGALRAECWYAAREGGGEDC